LRAPKQVRSVRDYPSAEGDLFIQHADELSGWNGREVGAVPGMAGFALHVAPEECYAAAGLPGVSLGEIAPSEQPRLSMAERVPAGVVAVISPFSVPLILSIPLGRTGPRPGQLGAAHARSAHGDDQTVNVEANTPFGGVAACGTGSRFGGAAANIEAFPETRWIAARAEPDVPVLRKFRTIRSRSHRSEGGADLVLGDPVVGKVVGVRRTPAALTRLRIERHHGLDHGRGPFQAE